MIGANPCRGAHVAGPARTLKPIHHKIILAVKLLETGPGSCTAGEVHDLLAAGGEVRSVIAVKQLLRYLTGRSELRRVAEGRYALPLPATAASAAPANAAPAEVTIRPPSLARRMAGRA